ncbi:hypothetical protein XM38_021520 [Halomicronema hongdechloris C2206]|uniref:RAMP superfamily protein n=1 Tax=Halomicronema hongdechloris C2206 TaxID=1641165 RepID=A0A1Z3HLN3_9CYAN|nr:RAMP superfamily protein [Halomicronema hongdechloris]ASC71200.1 hypothetical protein XM38_021520 [Halomicronema hongdechloris C2206]
MAQIPDMAKKVPMMFRAQVEGRCQLQRVYTDRNKSNEAQDSERWVSEWVEKAYPSPPVFDLTVQTRSYQLNWRFVTNGGQDDGIIRPVIGSFGWPFYPGSSMKGVFRQACNKDQAERYCGKELSGKDWQPGILRFHGGYPTNTQWTDRLVDIIHPQQERQVQREKTTSAFAQVSLYRPELQFGISSTELLDDTEWDTIWQIWERGLSSGLGCRVSAGYGQVADHAGQTLFKCRLKGQGQAPKLLDVDETGEFRPNIFRAAIRGHALRLFGGLTDATNAERLVNELFGSVQGSGDVGLLAMSFQPCREIIGSYGRGRWEQPTYEVEGDLYWMLNRPLADPNQRKALSNLIKALMHFAMVFGGFGKSWRRADHRIFYPDYAEQDAKPLIGCHWQWSEQSLTRNYKVRKLENIATFLQAIRKVARTWVQLQKANSRQWAKTWREAWHPQNVQVWGRVAREAEDSRAVEWLHGPYRPAMPTANILEGTIKQTSVTGKLNRIGRLWHRMYPIVRLVRNPEDPDGKPIAKMRSRPEYLELLTLFPNDSPEFLDFLDFLETQQTMFQKLWP